MTTLKMSFTVEEACLVTGFCRSRVYRAISDGSLKTFKAGRRRMISAKALEAFITELERQSEGKGRAAA